MATAVHNRESNCRETLTALLTPYACVRFRTELASSKQNMQDECVAAGLSQQALQQHSIMMSHASHRATESKIVPWHDHQLQPAGLAAPCNTM